MGFLFGTVTEILYDLNKYVPESNAQILWGDSNL